MRSHLIPIKQSKEGEDRMKCLLSAFVVGFLPFSCGKDANLVGSFDEMRYREVAWNAYLTNRKIR